MRYIKTNAPTITSLAIGISAAMLFTSTARAQVPVGWQAVTDNSGEYSVRADGARRNGGQGYAGATIKANIASPTGSAMLAQSVRADAFRGKRIRLSGFMKTIGVTEGSAVLFMRVDGEGVVQTSDYMQNRPLMLTTDWARQEVVVDVPRNAIGLTFGMMLGGSGQSWLDDVALEEVGSDVAVTGRPGGLYPNTKTSFTPRDLERRRRDQEIAYRKAAAEPLNLALRSDANAIVVAAAKHE